MLGLIVGRQPSPWVIVLIDQTTVDGVEVVNAAIPLAGRAVPVAWVDFQYPWTSVRPPSQNFVELCLRSEERRVGKECRPWRSPDHGWKSIQVARCGRVCR